MIVYRCDHEGCGATGKGRIFRGQERLDLPPTGWTEVLSYEGRDRLLPISSGDVPFRDGQEISLALVPSYPMQLMDVGLRLESGKADVRKVQVSRTCWEEGSGKFDAVEFTFPSFAREAYLYPWSGLQVFIRGREVGVATLWGVGYPDSEPEGTPLRPTRLFLCGDHSPRLPKEARP